MRCAPFETLELKTRTSSQQTANSKQQTTTPSWFTNEWIMYYVSYAYKVLVFVLKNRRKPTWLDNWTMDTQGSLKDIKRYYPGSLGVSFLKNRMQWRTYRFDALLFSSEVTFRPAWRTVWSLKLVVDVHLCPSFALRYDVRVMWTIIETSFANTVLLCSFHEFSMTADWKSFGFITGMMSFWDSCRCPHETALHLIRLGTVSSVYSVLGAHPWEISYYSTCEPSTRSTN